MRVLYLSCHEILEHNELTLFHELGYDLFSPGAYVEPQNKGDQGLRPGIPGLVYNPDVIQQYHRIGAAFPGQDGKDHLTKEFVDNFDVVIVMHIPRWIQNNWDAIKHKRVIWRTIGQSVASTEASLAPYKQQGMQIVRYSPREVYIPGFIGQDAFIRFYKDSEIYKGWNGNTPQIITFGQSMQQRGSACNYDLFESVTRPFARKLFGPENHQPGFGMGKVSWQQQIQELQNNRAYFYTGTHPASYTLNFIESWMCFPEETLVRSDTPIKDVWARDYEGDLIVISTQNQAIRCTPEHPFLTKRGFVRARDLSILDSILSDREPNNGVDTRRIGDLEKEFCFNFWRDKGASSSKNPERCSAQDEQTWTSKAVLNHLQSSTNPLDEFRGFLSGWDNRWGGNSKLQVGQRPSDCSMGSDPEYKPVADGLAQSKIREPEEQGDFIEEFARAKESIQFLLEGVSDPSFAGGLRALSFDQKRALWNFDWFYQEPADEETKERFLSIRNRLLDKDKTVKSERIVSIRRECFKGKVYNLSTTDGVYWAGGCLVHNCGIPMVCIGPKYGNAEVWRNHNLYEIPDLIKNGENGFISDDPKVLRDCINTLMHDPKLAKKISEAGRLEAMRHFNKDMIKLAWKAFLER